MEKYFLPKSKLGWSAIVSAVLAHLVFFSFSILVDQLGQTEFSDPLPWLMVLVPGLLVLIGLTTGYLSYFKKLDKSIVVLIVIIYLTVQTIFWIGSGLLEIWLQ